MNGKDQLETQSLMLIAAAMVGHVGNYAYHMITGRLLSETEYGLLMALFGLINLILIPMSALGLALSRAVAVDLQTRNGGGLRTFTKNWTLGMTVAAGLLLAVTWSGIPLLQSSLGINRIAPLLLAAFIPGFNLLLTLSGSLLQGLQKFKGLALRGSTLFSIRALLVAACLTLGWNAAGWALLAHLIGMAGALILSILFLYPALPSSTSAPSPKTKPILLQTLGALPILLAFSTLMTVDVILARTYFDPVESGRFAQAATLARMILWLPLPIAQVMFPKVVRQGTATSEQKHTLKKAMAYTVLLVGTACVGALIFAPLGLKIVYGLDEVSRTQISWLRGMAVAMMPLGPVYLLLQYELARGNIRRMIPLCLLAPGYLFGSLFFHHDPQQLIYLLMGVNSLALISCLPGFKND